MRLEFLFTLSFLILHTAATSGFVAEPDDFVREIQTSAVTKGQSPLGHWGNDPKSYTAWGTHTNRLIPVYTFGTLGAGPGIDLNDYMGEKSVYRNEQRLKQIYGKLPTDTLNPTAEYLDQTNLADIQRAALAAGKKNIILVVFDGMDWNTTRAAAIYNQKRLSYTSGRGTGTHFQEYTAGGTTQFGYMVTAPQNEGTRVDVNLQTVLNPGGAIPSGYDVKRGGPNPWSPTDDTFYLMGKNPPDSSGPVPHAYPDSASTATAMMSGTKTYNNAINVDITGGQASTLAHEAQAKGYAVGVVTSVPISHATPASAYSHNVDRDDYQDLSRDLLGLPSISHPKQPLPGVDVLIGCGYGSEKKADEAQGKNFVPGNIYLTKQDLAALDVSNGGKYIVAQRTSGQTGEQTLQQGVAAANASHKRLLGYFGIPKGAGHLPFQTANGDYNPPIGRVMKAEKYTPADLAENPTLSQMTTAALQVLSRNPKGFWLLVEAGDVDWANHDDNIDNSIGAVNSGDRAVKTLTDWVETHSNWKDTVLIVTADHGHYLVLEKPDLLAGQK